MDFQITNISMPVAALMASLIGASATITAALLQLRMAWRKEMKARERGQPVTSKSRRGPIAAVLVLLAASAIGGFALSQYLVTERRSEADHLRREFDSRLEQLSATAQRLEQVTLNQQAITTTAALLLEPCTTCTEQTPLRLTLCAHIPSTAAVNAVERHIRGSDGQELGDGRFVGRPFERLDGDNGKQVCQEVLHGNDGPGHSVQLLVQHVPNIQGRE